MVGALGGWLWLLVPVILLWAAGMTLAVLSKILASPDRDIRVRIRLLPSPRIEIDARPGSS
jgi:hypothetical protein